MSGLDSLGLHDKLPVVASGEAGMSYGAAVKENRATQKERKRGKDIHNNTLNDCITGFGVLALQNTRPFGAAISAGWRPRPPL